MKQKINEKGSFELIASTDVIPSYPIPMRIINSKRTKQPPILTSNLQCQWALQNIIHFISPWISRHNWAVLCERWHQDGLMGLEIYAGTIWAALAFKLQSSGEMGNDNCIKIRRISNWPSQWELAWVLALTGLCCTVGSPAVIRMWEQVVPTHWVHQAVSHMMRVDNDNRKMKREISPCVDIQAAR